jgi:nicotinamidase-related amidase
MSLSTLDEKVALIVIDLQNGVVDRDLAHPVSGVVKNSADLARAFRDRGLPVVLVNADGRPPGRTEGPSRSSGPVPEGWADLVPELDAQPTDILVTKQRVSAFSVPHLQATLNERGVTQLVLTGVATSLGVESTARAALDLDYHVVLVEDAMTDLFSVNHDHALRNIFPRLGEITTTAEVLRQL